MSRRRWALGVPSEPDLLPSFSLLAFNVAEGELFHELVLQFLLLYSLFVVFVLGGDVSVAGGQPVVLDRVVGHFAWVYDQNRQPLGMAVEEPS